MTRLNLRKRIVITAALTALAAGTIPLVGAPMASAGKDLIRCQATIINKSDTDVRIADARNGGGDRWEAGGNPTGKVIDAGDTFPGIQTADPKPGYCGLEIRIEPVKGGDSWKVLLKAKPDGGDTGADIRCDGACKVVDRDIFQNKVSARFQLNE